MIFLLTNPLEITIIRLMSIQVLKVNELVENDEEGLVVIHRQIRNSPSVHQLHSNCQCAPILITPEDPITVEELVKSAEKIWQR